jgi:short-subunit dehydrogenase
VNTGSLGGLIPFAGIAPYTAAKYAVVGLSESMRADLRGAGVDIGVSVLCPGPVFSRLRENSAAFQPGGDGGRDVPVLTEPRMPAEDVAAMVVDAIRSNRFWILTHPEYNDTIRERTRGIVDTNETVVAELL